MTSKEKLKCCKVNAVLRPYTPDRDKYPEKYAHLLFLYLPFRNEDDLKSSKSGTYIEKLNEPGVLDIINANKQMFEPFSDLVDSALTDLRSNITRCDANAQQENDDVSI